jgi:hypothetical protein
MAGSMADDGVLDVRGEDVKGEIIWFCRVGSSLVSLVHAVWAKDIPVQEPS